jgi:hypothetical protein
MFSAYRSPVSGRIVLVVSAQNGPPASATTNRISRAAHVTTLAAPAFGKDQLFS